MTVFVSLLLFTLLLGGGERVICDKLKINNVDDLISFSVNVNSGTSFSGTTVFLDSDIVFTDELSQQFEPIGKDDSKYFQGTFDGQGHTITSLALNVFSRYAGLFGYSSGMIIRNVVMDSSCSVKSSYSLSGDSYIGGIIGYFQSNSRSCIIESTVNMGSVSFNGDTADFSLCLGGVAGYLAYSWYEMKVKNCANYGSVAHIGESEYAYIGGIVGCSYGGLSKSDFIQNCLNHGAISNNNAKSSDQYIGGIVGYISYGSIVNCVSAGEVTSKYSSGSIGTIAGYADVSEVSYCYWTMSITRSAYGSKDSESTFDGSSFNFTTFELNESVSAWDYTGKSLLGALNAAADYYYLRDYSYWALNKNKNSVKFTINNRAKSLTMNSQIILLPNLGIEGKLWFDGWYTDASCETPLKSFEITENKELYGKWGENTNSYTITFDTRRECVTIESIAAQYLSVVSLPKEAERDNCTIAWWENNYSDVFTGNFIVPAHNLTLHAVWSCTRIKSADDFVDFSKVINYETSYSRTTVILDSDIDLSGRTFEPIGKDSFNKFRGSFDGQGYIISNLIMNTNSQYVGLFGYSETATIKNVVMDSSCSVTSSYSSSGNHYVGGIVGYCYSNSGTCVIENTFNMGSVSFSGNLSGDNFYLGGIIGCLYSQDEVKIKNCANYGSVAHTGASSTPYIGGVVGYSYNGPYSRGGFIQNCLNHGAISNNNAKSSDQRIGGIAGYTQYTVIDNCVSAGGITSRHSSGSVGAIVGHAYSGTNITHCLWTSDVGHDSANGTGSPEVTDSSLVATPNATTISELNSYAKSNSWNKWLLNANGASVTFKTGDYKGFVLRSQIVLLPDLADNSERTFSGWFWDEALSSPFTATEVGSDTTLHGTFCKTKYTVTLDVNGGDELESRSLAAFCNKTYGGLPNPTRTGHTFAGWFTEIGGEETRIEPGDRVTNFNNHTLYAHWTVNNYTVTFVFSNGKNDESRVFAFNTSIIYPADPAKEGHTFNGWDSDIEYMPECDLTVRAQWSINNYTIAFDFSNGTVVERTFAFNTLIEYPEDIVEREGYSFSWDRVIEIVPARDLSFTLQWTVNNYTVTFVFNNGESDESRIFAFDTPIEYPESPKKEGYKFIGWDNYTMMMPARNIILKAHWNINNYTVTFDGNGGTPSKESIVVTYNSAYGNLPSAAKEGYSFLGWFTEDNEEVTSEMIFTIARDRILYAHWEINSYTVTFNFNNETAVSAVFPFNETITYPEEISREGFVFNGWLPNPERMPAENITVFTQWNEETKYVEITFGRVDLSEEEIKEIIEKYVPEGEEFTIEKFEEDESGGMRVIIKFTDKEKASEFIRNVDEKKRPEDGISHVRTTTGHETSFAFSTRSATYFLFFL